MINKPTILRCNDDEKGINDVDDDSGLNFEIDEVKLHDVEGVGAQKSEDSFADERPRLGFRTC